MSPTITTSMESAASGPDTEAFSGSSDAPAICWRVGKVQRPSPPCSSPPRSRLITPPGVLSSWSWIDP
jgi:hypothetical protein